jgi:hypothetical protein
MLNVILCRVSCMLIVINKHFKLCHYAECCYDECHYCAECTTHSIIISYKAAAYLNGVSLGENTIRVRTYPEAVFLVMRDPTMNEERAT